MLKRIVMFLIAVVLSAQTLLVMAVGRNDNLFVNGDFEELLSTGGWGSKYTAKYERTQDNPQGGEWCVRINHTMATSTWVHDFRLTPGETYDLTMWARTSEGKGEVKLTAAFVHGYAYDPYTNKDGQISSFTATVGEKWTEIKHTFTYTGKNTDGVVVDDNVQLGLRFNRHNEKLDIYMDSFSLVSHGLAKKESERMPKTFDWKEDPLPKQKSINSKSFTDTQAHWAETTINALSSDGVINGVTDTEYAPERNVTRAEFITLLTNTFGIKRKEQKTSFKDITSSDWYYENIVIAENIGLIPSEMVVDGKILPDAELKRAEAAAILVKFAKVKQAEPTRDSINFIDASSFGVYASYISDATVYGAVNGYADGTFKANNTIKRAEAAEMIKNALELTGRRYFYVDNVNGDDDNNGTLSAPFKTIYAAQEAVRENNKNMFGNIYVFLKTGTHYMSKTLDLTQADSGTNGYNIIYTSYGDGKAMLSGAESKVYDWELYDKEKGIYQAYVGDVNSRHMFVNGMRATRAKSDEALRNYQYSPTQEYQIVTKSKWVADLTNNGDVELVHNGSAYCNFRPMVEDIKLDGETVRMKLYDDFMSKIRTNALYMSTVLWIENAYELIDRPGEWYWNRDTGYLYYMPRKWEDLSTAEITMPNKERLIKGTGVINDNTYEPLHNIAFKNVDFGYTGYYNTTEASKGLALYQNAIRRNTPNNDTTKETHTTLDGAVEFKNISYVDIEDCEFTKIGGIALKAENGIQHFDISGNHFYDLSGDSIQIGELDSKNDDSFTPHDKRYYKADINITNNYIHDTAVEWLSAGGMAVTNLQYSQIKNNEIFRTTYSGIHLGYGFASRAFGLYYETPVTYNYIHNTNMVKFGEDDGGAIYHMSTTYGDVRDALTEEGRNKISYNYVADLGSSVNSIYSDEGSSWLEISNNVFDREKKWYTYGIFTTGNQSKYNIVKDNYISADTLFVMDVLRSPYTEWYEETNGVIPDKGMERIEMGTQVGEHTYIKPREIETWPEGALEIVENAGITPEYIDKFPEEFQDVRIEGQDYGWIDPNPIRESDNPAVFDISSGEVLTIPIKGENRKRTEGYISPDRIYIENLNPDVVEILPDNTVKGLKQGKANLIVEVICGANKDVVTTYPVEIYVDDEVAWREDAKRWYFWHNGSMGVFKPQMGIPYKFDLSFTTKLGRKIQPLEVEFDTDKPEYAYFDEEGQLVAKAVGEGNVLIKMTWGGNRKTEEFEVPFTSIDNEMYTDFTEEQIVDIDESFLDAKNWTFAGNNTPQVSPESVKLNSDKIMIYNKEPIKNKLLHFRMKVNHKAGWPSIALNCSDSSSHLNNEYIITFYQNALEWQRYNNGKRSVLWGVGNMFDGTVEVYGGRPGIKFEYNKEYDVGIGAFDVENGVRIVIYLDGLKVFDQIDYINNEKYDVQNAPVLSGGGYFGIHSTESGGSNVELSVPKPRN